MKDSRSSSAPASRERGRSARVLMAGFLTVGVFGGMSMFGGMSYASHALGGGPSPSVDEYCATNAEPDHKR